MDNYTRVTESKPPWWADLIVLAMFGGMLALFVAHGV